MGYSCIGVGFVAFYSMWGQRRSNRVIVVQNIQCGVIVVQFI
jgi:hypothetical protein